MGVWAYSMVYDICTTVLGCLRIFRSELSFLESLNLEAHSTATN